MKISRRNMLIGLGATGVAGLAYAQFGGTTTSTIHSTGAQALNIPPLDDGQLEGGVRSYDLNMQTGVSQFFDNVNTASFGINGAYLGPTLKMRVGETVRMNVNNNIGHTSSLHWHGMHLPADQDGGPHQTIENGSSWQAEFEVKQNAATLWYHSHMMGETAYQVYHGLAGVIIVEDEQANSLGLPQDYGIDDIPLVLQDRKFHPDGRFDYTPGMEERMMGHFGDTMVVNGTVNPYFDAASDSLRIRLLNGSNARFYDLSFDDGRSFHQIASDGGLLEQPVKLTSLVLSPGERAELIIDLSDGKTATLSSKTPGSDDFFSDVINILGSSDGRFKILEIRPNEQRKAAIELPTKLTTLDVVDETIAVKTRTFDLDMGMGVAMMLGNVGDNMSINGKPMDMKHINEVVKLDSTEIWHITNSSFAAHPFHIHDVQFRIIDRDGKPPSPTEAGLKDTVLIPEGESVRLLLKFTDYSDPDSPYMFHCHILEHEDEGMMGQFTVVA